MLRWSRLSLDLIVPADPRDRQRKCQHCTEYFSTGYKLAHHIRESHPDAKPIVLKQARPRKLYQQKMVEPITTEQDGGAADTYDSNFASAISVLERALGVALNKENVSGMDGDHRQDAPSLSPSDLISLVLDSQEESTAQHLEDGNVQKYIDILQSYIDNLDVASTPADDRRTAMKLLTELSRAFNQLPSQLLLPQVKRTSDWPLCGGGYADIYQGSLDGSVVALKRLRIFLRGETEEGRSALRKALCRETLVWRSMRHPRVWPSLGMHDEKESSALFLVTPWAENGNVIDYVQNRALSSADVQVLLFDVASGLAYLHSNGMVHGDIRGSNILVDSDNHARLADFGLSQFLDAAGAEASYGANARSVRWTAPEILFEAGPAGRKTEKSDIYALACTAWEMYTSVPPFPETTAEMYVLFRLKEGARPPRPNGERTMGDELWEMVQKCWADEPERRPTIYEVLEGRSP